MACEIEAQENLPRLGVGRGIRRATIKKKGVKKKGQ